MDEFDDEFDGEPPTQPSTPSSLHPYRSNARTRTSYLSSLELREFLQRTAPRPAPPTPPIVDPWWRALVRLLLLSE